MAWKTTADMFGCHNSQSQANRECVLRQPSHDGNEQRSWTSIKPTYRPLFLNTTTPTKLASGTVWFSVVAFYVFAKPANETQQYTVELNLPNKHAFLYNYRRHCTVFFSNRTNNEFIQSYKKKYQFLVSSHSTSRQSKSAPSPRIDSVQSKVLQGIFCNNVYAAVLWNQPQSSR